MGKPIQKTDGSTPQRPLICAPLVGKTKAALIEEIDAVAAKKPDLLEWRVDFYKHIGKTEDVLETASLLKAHSKGIPILFTRRSIREGGEPITVSEQEVTVLYEQVMKQGLVDVVDVELSCPEAEKERLRAIAKETETQWILSYHDFQRTPSEADILAKLQEAEAYGADVGKVAVMPETMADVLTLMQATQKAASTLTIPVITMAMGRLGTLSRMAGGACGSALTFAIANESSAPGQMPIEELRVVLDVIDRYVTGP